MDVAGSAPPYESIVPYRHLGGWTIATAIVLGVAALQLALLTEWVVRDADTQASVRDQFFVARSDLAFNHSRLALLTKGVGLVLVAAAVLWLVWQYQAQANLRALHRARFHPGAVIVAWLIPGLNVAASLMAMRQLWLGTDLEKQERRARRPRTTPVLWLWWASGITAATLVLLALLRTPASGASTVQLIARDNLLVPGCLLGIAAAVLGIVLLVRIEGRFDLAEDVAGRPSWQTWSDSSSNRRTSA